MTKIKNTKKGMAKKTLSMSLVVAMLATSNVPVWAAEFSDGTDTTNITSEANAFTDAEADTPVVNDASSDAVSAQATDNEVTLTTDSTVKSLSTLKKDGLTVTTNYKDGTTKDFGCVSFVLKNGAINIGDANPSVNASNQELGYYVTATGKSNNKITTTDKKSYTLKLDNWDEYVGKTITAILYQDTTSASGYDNGNVYKTVDIKVTADDSYDCVGNRFTKNVGWGTSLNDIKDSLVKDSAYTLKYGATVSNYIWRDQNDAEVADTTKATTKDDVNKTYSLYATLQGDAVPDNDEVYLGQITITSAGIVNSEVSSVEWDCTTDGDGNPKFTYDGTAHYPKIKKVVLKDGTVINEGDKDTTITYADITVAQHTNANTGISYPVTIKTANYSLTYTKKLVIEQADLATGADLAVTKGFEFNPKNTYAVADEEAAKKVGLTVNTKAGKTLEIGSSKDYTVTVISSPKNEVGTENAIVTITGTGNYKGTITKKAPITAYTLKENTATVTLSASSVSYDGNAQEPTVTVTIGSASNVTTLEKDKDYTVSYSNNKEVGTATVTITGKGNYSGTVTKTFEITAASDAFKNELMPAIEADFTTAEHDGKTTYTGKAIDPVKDTYVGMKYVKNRDFTVEYVPQNVKAGDVEVKITGIGNFKGCKGTIEDFAILQRPVTDKDVKVSIKGLTYSAGMTDKQIKDAVTLTYNGMTLVENTDYELYIRSKIGKNVTLEIVGLGNYSGWRTETVSVTAKDISTVTLPKIEAQKYTGSDIKVEGVVDGVGGKVGDSKFEIKDGNYTLKQGTDYQIAGYENNKNVGTATINIVGIGAYSGKAAISFPIVAAELNGTIVFRGENGDTPVIPDQEYDYAKVTSSNGYTFDIAAKDDNTTNDKKLRVIDNNGKVVDPNNYTVTYKDNTAAGTATITVEGKAGYKLNAVNTFRIVPAKLTKTTISKSFTRKDSETLYYTGEEIKPAMNVSITDGTYKLVEGTDYKIEYSDNTNAGKGKAKLVGLGNYAGVVKDVDVTTANNLLVEFDINKTVIKSTDVVATDVAYAGGVLVTPNITVKNPNSNKALVAGTDYTVEVIDGGINVGQAHAIIKLSDAAKKNYVLDSSYVTFNVTAKSLSDVTVTPITNQVATGEQIKPAITVMNGSVKLVEGKDYEVSYGENKEIGEGTVTIKALSSNKNYTGSQTVKFNIVKDAPVVGKTMISDVKVVGNKATVILSGEADGASGYDYVISTDKDCTTSKDYDAISKNQVKTSTTFKYVQKGTYYAYCHAWTRDKNGKKVFGEWSEGKEFEVEATTPAAPVITEVKVKGSTITVTYNKVSNAAGYDVVLGISSKNDNGELRPYRYGDHKILNISKNKVTVQFKNVPKKNWVVGMHAFTKDPDTNKKVFSRWSNLMPANVE